MPSPPKTKPRLVQSEAKPPPVYFLALMVENIRCFGPSQTLDLSDGTGQLRQWTILLGDNGVGKTTLLQCLAGMQSSASAQVDGEGAAFSPSLFMPTSSGQFMRDVFVARNREGHLAIEARLSLNADFTSNMPIKRVDEWWVAGNPEPWACRRSSDDLRGLICYGYGASRRNGPTSLSSALNLDTTITLFEDEFTLVNGEEWLLQADYAAKSLEGTERRRAEARRDHIKDVLVGGLLPDVSDIRFTPTPESAMRTTVQAKTPYGWVSIRDISFGYRTIMAWVVDFASRLLDRYPESPNPLAEPAIALVDEIDLHLHPRWQRSLIKDLSNLFPNTQFIVTAHSPLIVQAATDANVVLLRREGDHVVIDDDVQAIKGWRVDQVLTSDLFGLESARPPELDGALAERTRILSKPRLTKTDRARLAELEAQIGDLPTGETPQDMAAMDIIRRAAELLEKK